MTVKISTDSFRVIAAFERLTKVQPRDCIITDECVYFLVDSNKIGLAIGKDGIVIKKVGSVLARPIKLFEYSEDPATMLKNIMPAADNIEVANKVAKFSLQAKDRPAMMGRGGKNIKIMKEFLNRHFGIEEVKIR